MSKIQGMAGKGALVIQDPDNPVPKIIKFQYQSGIFIQIFSPSKPASAGSVKMTLLKFLE